MNITEQNNASEVRIPNNQSIFFSGIDDSCKCNIDTYNYWTETIINGDIEVPSVKPSILEIDSVNIKLQIISQKVVKTPAIYDCETSLITAVTNLQNRATTGRKLIIEGLACVSVSYLAKTNEESLHTFHDSIPFSSYIILPQYPESCLNLDALDINYNIVSCIESIVVKQFTDRNVTLCIPFVLQAIPESIESTKCQNAVNTISNCSSESQITESCFNKNSPIIKGVCSETKIENLLTNQTENLWVETDVSEILELPEVKPSIEQILSLTSKVDIMCLKVIDTPSASVPSHEGLVLTGKKLVIEGTLRQRITYTTSSSSCNSNDNQSIHSVHFDVPISSFIVLPEETSVTDKFVVVPCIEDIFICAIDKRKIFKNTTIFYKATSAKYGLC